MTHIGKQGTAPADPQKYAEQLRKKSVSALRRAVERYASIARAPAHLHAELLDRLHFEQSKLVTPYGATQTPVPKEVTVENWTRRGITASEIEFSPKQLQTVVDLLTTAGAADSSFVQLLKHMIAEAR